MPDSSPAGSLLPHRAGSSGQGTSAGPGQFRCVTCDLGYQQSGIPRTAETAVCAHSQASTPTSGATALRWLANPPLPCGPAIRYRHRRPRSKALSVPRQRKFVSPLCLGFVRAPETRSPPDDIVGWNTGVYGIFRLAIINRPPSARRFLGPIVWLDHDAMIRAGEALCLYYSKLTPTVLRDPAVPYTPARGYGRIE